MIQLLEVDLNTVFGQWLMHRQALDCNITSPLQWGSRPNQSSEDASIMKRLTFMMISGYATIIFNNDGEAAFDWMIPLVGASIVLQRLGDCENSV